MRLGMVGLGRMGANMARRLMRGGHEVVVTDLSADAVKGMAGEGAIASSSLEDFVTKLGSPRIAWLMVPAGGPTESSVQALALKFDPGDILIDGGNSYFKDDIRRSQILVGKGIHYVDVGTSGGVWGLERGYCMMIGGPKEAFQQLDPIFKTLAPGRGDIPRTPGREKMAAKLSDEAIQERVRELRLESPPDETAVAQEIVRVAARSDITEEVTRFTAHLAHWSALADGTEPCGRKLDFLLQEMNREINTIGSKADGLQISELIISAKAELERMREQVQNVE